jgi:signal transduction histidine kinase
MQSGRSLFQALVNAQEMAVWALDAEYRITSANDRARTAFGDVVGKVCYRTIAGRDSICPGCTVASVLGGAQDGKSRQTLKDAAGERVHVDQIVIPIRNSDGSVCGAFVFLTDASGSEQAEEALLRSERMALIGRLASGVAHEFNNIHAVVAGFLELLSGRDDLPEDVRERLSLIHAATMRATGITRNLLALSRKQKTIARRVQLANTVKGAVTLVAKEFATEGIELEEHIGEPVSVAIDEGQIQQVILNLLMNARHALLDRPEKRITVSTGRERDRAFVRVSDTGCGIAPENLPKVFAPFFTTKGEHSEKGSGQASVRGTGLGLSVCQTMVENHGGSMDVASALGQGSTFTVWLPVSEPEPNAVDDEEPAPEPGAFSGARVMILDDEPAVRRLLREFLEIDGYEVSDTDDGQAAMRSVVAGDVDLVIVDLQMPKMSGEEFLRQVCNVPLEKRPVALALTGKLTQTGTANLSRFGVYDILAKPFRGKTIRRCAYAALKSRRT